MLWKDEPLGYSVKAKAESDLCDDDVEIETFNLFNPLCLRPRITNFIGLL